MANNKNAEQLKAISPKLTEEILQKSLKLSSGENDVKLTSYEIEGGGSAKGDSYLSIVYRIKVHGISSKDNRKLTSALVAKGLPANIGRRKTFRSCEFFRNETAFYNEVVPRFMKFQEKKELKNPFHEIPRCFGALADGENDFVLMEDVSQSGYMPPKRQEGFDFEHCCVVLRILGRFHALSLAMKDQDPEEFKKAASSLKETYYYSENKWWYEDMLQKFKDIAIDAVSKELPDTIYEEKLKKFVDDGLYDRMIEMVKPKEPYAVIGHGDAWKPNFLLRYKKCEGDEKIQVEGVRMLDFQLVRYGSPILDISFLIYSCTTSPLRDSHFDDLLQVYYKSVCEFVNELGSSAESVFPYKGFQNEVTSYFSFGLGMSLESVPLTVVDDSEAPDVDLIKGDEAIPLQDIWIVHPFKTKEGRLRLSDNVKHAIDNGYL